MKNLNEVFIKLLDKDVSPEIRQIMQAALKDEAESDVDSKERSHLIISLAEQVIPMLLNAYVKPPVVCATPTHPAICHAVASNGLKWCELPDGHTGDHIYTPIGMVMP